MAALGFLRLGFMVDFLSHATIVGFMAGAATVVSLQQLKGMLGLQHFTNETDLLDVLRSVFFQSHNWRWQSAVFGCFILIFLLLSRHINKDVTEAIQKVAAAYDCKIVEGVLSHQLKQFVIDGNKVVISVTNPEMRVDDVDFEENEVYAVDIVASTGDGKPKLLDEKQTTIYKRAVDKNYHLKMKSSRFIFSEINQKFPILPFTARALEEKRARLGLVECVNHDLLQPYPVLHEKPGDLVAHIKFTVLLMPNGSDRITSHPLQDLQPTKSIEDDQEIKAWLSLGTKTKKKGGGKKKKASKKGDPMEAECADGASNGATNQDASEA